MNISRMKFFLFTVWCIFVITGIFSGVIILGDNMRPDVYEYLYILPFGFSLISFVFFGLFMKIGNHIEIGLILFLYYLRNCIVPYLMSRTLYISFFNRIIDKDVFWATLLMLYETTCVFGALYYFVSDKRRESKHKIVKKIKCFRYVLFILTSVCVFAFLFYPDNFSKFNSVFDLSRSGLISKMELEKGSEARVLTSLAWVIFPWLQVFFSVYLIHFIRRHIGNNIFGLISAIIVVLVQGLVLFGANGFFVAFATTLFYIIYRDFSKQHVTTVLCMFSLVIFFLFSIGTAKSSGGWESGLFTISLLLQAYIPGVANFAGIFSVPNTEVLSHLFFDFYNMLIFKEAIFGLNGDRLVVTYTQYNDALSQLIPCTAQIYYYLGFMLAPIFSVMCAKWALKYANNAKLEHNVGKSAVYALGCIYLCITPAMYNITVTGLTFISIVWPLQWLASHMYELQNFEFSQN